MHFDGLNILCLKSCEYCQLAFWASCSDTLALAQVLGEIGRREGAIMIVKTKVDGHLCDMPHDMEIGRMVWQG